MPRISIVDRISNLGIVPGYYVYDHCSIISEYSPWYDQDIYTYYIDRVACTCTAWKEILTIQGYLPHITWIKMRSIDIPNPELRYSFVICEEFDKSSRVGNENAEYVVKCSLSQNIVFIDLGFHESEVYVSPHSNLIIGATVSKECVVLSSIYYLNVQNYPFI